MSAFFMGGEERNCDEKGCQSHMGVSLEAVVPGVSVALMSAAGKQQKLHDVDREVVG